MKHFAYGSNMLTRRLTDSSRAPSAVACGVATALGFVVRFHKVGADGSGKCTLVATVAEAEAACGDFVLDTHAIARWLTGAGLSNERRTPLPTPSARRPSTATT